LPFTSSVHGPVVVLLHAAGKAWPHPEVLAGEAASVIAPPLPVAPPLLVAPPLPVFPPVPGAPPSVITPPVPGFPPLPVAPPLAVTPPLPPPVPGEPPLAPPVLVVPPLPLAEPFELLHAIGTANSNKTATEPSD
jgi:hypothetical protein